MTYFKLQFPDRVFICRGNHEEESLNRVYSFHDEVSTRFPPSQTTYGLIRNISFYVIKRTI